jgi:LPXTG-motif cell wall-anchored protein
MSASVSEEWTAAIEQKKDLLPLLLDATPLPKPLSEFQYIDFRGTVGDNHGPEPSPKAVDSMPSAPSRAGSTQPLPASAPKSPIRWFAFGGVAAALFVAVSMFVLWPLSRETAPELALPSPPAQTSPSTAQPSQPPSIEPPQKLPAPKPSPPPPPSTSTGSPSVIGALMAGLALIAGTLWYLRKKRGRSRGPGDHEIPPDLMPHPSSSWESPGSFVERQMASEIKAEIARRTST